jgi:hypothetical protein
VAAKKKTKMGRPPLPPEERSATRVTLRLLPRERAVLTALAKQLRTTDVGVLRIALDELAASRL